MSKTPAPKTPPADDKKIDSAAPPADGIKSDVDQSGEIPPADGADQKGEGISGAGEQGDEGGKQPPPDQDSQDSKTGSDPKAAEKVTQSKPPKAPVRAKPSTVQVRCLLENCSESVNGVAFEPGKDPKTKAPFMVSEPISQEVADAFLLVPGYELHE